MTATATAQLPAGTIIAREPISVSITVPTPTGLACLHVTAVAIADEDYRQVPAYAVDLDDPYFVALAWFLAEGGIE